MPSASELGFAVLLPLPYMMERSKINKLEANITVNGVGVAPSAVACTVFDPDGNEASTGAGTPSVSPAGHVSYSYTPAATYAYAEGWRVRWDFTISGEVYTVENSAMLVRERGTCPVTTGLLWLECPQLNPTGKPITKLTAAEQDRFISGAWVRVQLRLIEHGKRPWLVIGTHSLGLVTLSTVKWLIYESLAHTMNEAYAATAERYRLETEEAWKRVQLTYDETQDGVPDDGRVSAKPGQFWLGRG